MLLAVSDLVWQALIAAGVTITLAWMQQRTKQSVDKSTTSVAESAAAASAKVDEVAVSLTQATLVNRSRTDKVAKTLEDVSAKQAVKVDEVAANLVENTVLTATTMEVVQDIKELVNGKTHVLLKEVALLAGRVAALTGKPEDIEAAEVAKTAEVAKAAEVAKGVKS